MVFGKKRSLLIVDDEVTTLFAFKDLLGDSFQTIDVAQSVAEARTLLECSMYQGAIVDLRLCGSNGTEGFDVVEMIRSVCPDCRIIMLTAFAQPETKKNAFTRGVDSFFEKPVSPEIIRTTFQS